MNSPVEKEQVRRSCNPLPGHPKAWVATALAWAAGYIDVVGWLVLYHVYTSHMTGNTATFAQDLMSGNIAEALRHGWPILPFIGGLLFSAAATKSARRRKFHSSFSIALITEIALLAVFLFAGTAYLANGVLQMPENWKFYSLLSLPAAAMGVQTVTVTNINGLRVYTTYLTGSLSKFSEALIDYFFWVYDHMRDGHAGRLRRVLRVSYRHRGLQHAALTAALWMGFFAGGLCGAVLESRYALFSLLAPIGVLIGATAVDFVRPVAAADEPAAEASAH